MSKREVVSMRGERVDFDLFDVKSQISSKVPSTEVKQREDYIFSKRKRGSKRTVNKMLDETPTQAPEASTEKVEAKPVEVEAAAPEPTKPKKKIIKKKTKGKK